MNRLTTFVKEFPNGRQALAVRAGVEVTPAAVVEALELPAASGVLLLSGGAGLMPDELLDRLSVPFQAVGEVLAQEHATVIDGGTQAGVMALMGAALDKSGRTAPYIGVLPVDFLGELHPFKWLASRQFVFLARDLTPSRLEGDEIYPVGVQAVPLEHFVNLVERGELQDATAVAALFLAQRFLEGEATGAT